MDPVELKAIEWPKATMRGVEYTLRLSWAARSQLVAWGLGGPGTGIPVLAWAAAMAGNFDAKGKWRSARFLHWMELADTVTEAENELISNAVEDALKKASPESTIKVETKPAEPTEAIADPA